MSVKESVTDMKSAIYTLFFISGFTGLVYEVTWTRMLTTVFGSTTYAITSVLSGFMGGLAIGSFVIGRYIERKKNPILVYAFLEIGIGITALLIPKILKILDNIYPLIYEYTTSYVWLLILTKVVLSLLVLFVPTFLMGGTLPVLCKFFISRPKESGKQVGILYAINTIGAAIGCFITGFFLIELLGISKTIQLVAAVNFLLGIAFFILNIYHRQIKSDIETTNIENIKKAVNDSSSYNKIQPFYSILILIGFSLAGFVSLSYEVLWTRLLVFKLKMTIYAFSIMLTTFLMGIAIGSIVVAISEKYNLIKNHSKAFGVIQSLIGLMGLSTIILFGQIDSIPIFDIVGFFKSSISWNKLIFTEILLAGMIMIVPTIFMGMTFPLVSRIFTQNIKIVGKTIGSIYSVNTIGCILGSCLTGFILVKTLGTQKSIIIVSLIALIIGTAIVLFNRQGFNESKNSKSFPIVFSAIIMWSIAVGLIVWLPKDILFKYYNIYEEQIFEDTQIIYANEGIECITTVHKYPGGFKGLSTSSVNVAGTHYTHRTTQKLQAHIPMLVHPNPKEILQVGFGSGETSYLVTTYDIEQLDLVEISSEVIETATKYFKEINKDVANHPKFNPIIMDGANYIYLAKKKYDLILNDASWPGYTGCSALYSKDYFENAKKLLKPGGIMTSWFPIAEGEEFKILLKTFHSVFPNVSVWYAVTHVNKHALVVGSLHKIEIDTEDFLRRFEQHAQNDLKSVDLDNPIFFLDAYQMDETVLDNLLDDSIPIHTIDHPILEFTERNKDPVENISAVRIMAENNVSVIPYLKNSKNIDIKGKNILQSLESTRDATKLVMTGYVRVIGSGEYQPKYESEFKEALMIEPKHPGANHFFFRMFNIHLNLANYYAENYDHKNATYCYELAFKEINFYISLRPDSAKAYHNRGLIYLNGGEYLGLERKESLNRAQEDFSKALTLSPEYALENDIGALIDRINYLLR
jgi:spermidine synthase